MANEYTKRYLEKRKSQKEQTPSLYQLAKERTESQLKSYTPQPTQKQPAKTTTRVNKLDVQDERAYQSKKRSSFSERMKTAGSSSISDQLKSFSKERSLIRQYERDKRKKESDVFEAPFKITPSASDSEKISYGMGGTPFSSPSEIRKQAQARLDYTKDMNRPSAGEYLGAIGTGGLSSFNQALFSTLDFFTPTELLFGEGNDPVSKLNRYYSSEKDKYMTRTQDTFERSGEAGKFIGELGVSTVQTLPNTILALMSGGGSIAAQGSSALGQSATGLASAISTAFNNMIRTPTFWTSALQMVGPAYDEARAEGAGEIEAMTTALISGIINSGVEVGGGLETLPAQIRSGSTNAIRGWVSSMLDEGKEEVVQGIVDNLTRKSIYDQNREWFSTDDENAVFNPVRSAEEFAGGALVGGLLGGGQILTSNAINRAGAAIQEQAQRKADAIPPSATRDDILYQLAQDMANDRLGGVNEDKVSVAPRSSNPYTVYTQGPQPAQKVNPARDPAMVDYIAETLGKNGSVSMRRLYDGEMDTDAYSAEFLESYSAGMRGDEKPAPQSLTPAQSEAAYVAGQADRKGKTAAPIGRQTGGDTYGRTEEALVGRHEARGYDPGGAGGPVLRERGAAQTGDSRANRGNEAIPAGRPGPAGAGEAGREVTQTARSWQEDPAAFTARSTERGGVVRQMGNVSVALGERGSEALTAIYDGSVDADSFYDWFSAYYHAGVAGMDMDKVKTGSSTVLNSVQRKAAYLAGQNDAEAGLRREQRAAQYAKSAGSDSGLIYDDFVRQAVESGRTMEDVNGETREYLNADTAAKINRVAKALGVRVQFVDSISVNGHNDAANAQIKGSEVQIQRDNENPVMFLVGHEITHRIQELAPKEYRAFRAAAANDRIVQAAVKMQMENHARRGGDITYEEALDEAAADYAGRLIDDGKVLDDFIARNREDRTLLQKVRDAIRSIIKKLTGAEREKAQTAEGKLTAALEAAARQVRRLQKRGADAKMEATRHSLKEDMVYGGAREESRESFYARGREGTGGGFTVVERGPYACAYRGVARVQESAARVRQSLQAWGIDSAVVDGPVYVNKGGVTTARPVREAATIQGMVFISNGTTIPPLDTAGHEAYHAWKGTSARTDYTDTVRENLNYGGREFLTYQQKIADAYFGGDVELSDVVQLRKFEEELFAYISGHLNCGDYESTLRAMFRDYDTVKAAWEKLVIYMREVTEYGTRQLYSQEHGQAMQQVQAPAGENGELQAISGLDTGRGTDWGRVPGVREEGNEEVKFSLKAPEAEARQARRLQDENTDGTMSTARNSFKEDLEHGRTREETREAFLRRANGDGLAVYEGETAAYGFRRVGDASAGGYPGEATREARETWRELTALGISSDVIEGPVLRNRGGITVARDVPQAVTADGSHIFISKDASISPRNVAGHEAFHLWKRGKGRDAYIEIVEENLIYTHPSFLHFQSTIAESYLGGEADLSNDAQMNKLREEILAYISGNIHEGTNDADMRPMFYDFDAVKTAWDTLVKENTVGTRLPMKTPSAEDAQFSLKGDTVSKSYAAILEENQLLRERVEYWKGQTRKTKRVTTDKKAVEQSARELIHSYGSDLAVDDISGDLQSLYDYIASGYDGKNELTYTEARRRAEAIARQLVGKAVAADTELYDQYSDLRNYLRTTKLIVSEADSHNIPDYGAWRKQRFGRLNLTRGDVTNIDRVYEDLSERWPEFFNSQREISTADQLLRIAEVADTLYDITEYNPFSEYMEQAVDGAANEVMEIFFDLPQTRKTFADRQAMKLQEAKAKGQRQAQRIREQNSTRLETLRQENRERVRRAVQRERDARTRQLDRMKEHYQARDAAGRERRSAAELRRKITRHAKALSQKLLRPTDKQHIPENLRTAVASLLDAINLESVYTVDPETGKRRKNGEGEPVKRTEAFRALRLAYAEIAKDGGDYTLIIDPDLMDNLNELESMKNTPIAEMGTDQLATVWAALKAVEASIRTANKMLGTSRFETISSFADGIRADNILRKDRGDYRGVAGKIDRLVNLDMLTPQSYFHRLGKTGEELFRMMRAAQDRHITIMRQAQKKTAEIIGKTDINKLEREKHTFDLSGGDVTMSTAQIMGLYELMKRKQAQDHILKGGIRPDTIQSGRGLREDRRSEPVKVSVEDLAAITGMLTEEQIRIADRLQKFMGGTLAELGNEASMAVYGYRKFTEKDYYPIKVDKNQTRRDISKEAQATTIAGRGFTKSVIPKANNAVMVESIFDTYSNHVNDMATYAAWLPTMENIRRIRDFTFRDDKGSRTGDVKSIIERVFGRNGNAYLNKLVDDINQGVRANGTGNFTDSLVGNYKAAAVAANIRVILQQPTAILRAMNSLDPKYLLSGTVKRGDWDKVKRYAPIAVWKDWGYFDINTGRQMKDVLFSSDSKMEKVKQAAMAGASKADSFAWARLWNAVEAEMRDKRHDLKPGTDAFYQAVGTRFSEIVDQTQVVDGLLQRSQIMRSPDALTKMATSFMAEPTKTYNMFVNAVYDLRHATGKDARNDTKRALARTSAALVVSFAVNAVMQSIVDALRDDDKERDYWEKFLTAYTGFTGEEETFLDYWNSFWDGNLEANFNPAGYIPYFKDLLSIMQGYDVSRMDMEPVSKVLEAAANMKKALSGEGRHSLAGASANLMGEVSRLLGIPIANLKRDVQSVIATAAIEMDDYLMQYRIDSAMLNMNYSGNFKNFMDILYSASKNDPEVYEIIYDDMVKRDLFKTSTQTTEERIASAMESRMKRDQGVESVEDLQNRFLSPDSSRTYDRILKKASSSAIWKSAGSEVIKEAENKIYQISAGTKTGEKLKEKIEAGVPYGIDEADYVLYQMALDIADAQNKDPEKRNESFDQAEAEEAINMLTGLSDSAKSYLWQSTNKAWKSENNPWGGLAPNEEDISIEAKDEAVNRLLSGIYW
jgi:hypothetical protein